MTRDATSTAYRQLDVGTVGVIVEPFLRGPVRDAAEIGDGNLNLVFRVSSTESSVVVKQALPYLRLAGEGWPLTLDRARIESSALRIYAKLSPAHVPHVHSFRPDLAAIIMEDLRGHVLWRGLLIRGQVIKGVAEQLGVFCGRALLGTSAMLMPSSERVPLQLEFSGRDLCAITEDLVFTAPFIDAKSNRIDGAIAEAAERLRTNDQLRETASWLRSCFRSRAESLIHGDLHTGSVMVRETGGVPETRVIDPEFAVFGPIGFDLGLLLANLALSWHSHYVTGNDSVAESISEEAASFWRSFTDTSASLWPEREPWFARFIAIALDDCGRYAGLEMSRRIVGMAKVADIECLSHDHRAQAAAAALACATALILQEAPRDFDELWERATGQVAPRPLRSSTSFNPRNRASIQER